MGMMDVSFERKTEEALLSMTCGCGGCHPTATYYRDDPSYDWHDSRLAEGPCCCGRFFVIGHDVSTAESRATAMAEKCEQEGKSPHGYVFKSLQVPLPWGSFVEVVSADLAN
ncbi:MAG: hypothetical protein Q8Q07_01760 [Dehalococcoidales bacterium]|nr:hypothetical protein [Dehalococcoidales bacterium]